MATDRPQIVVDRRLGWHFYSLADEDLHVAVFSELHEDDVGQYHAKGGYLLTQRTCCEITRRRILI